MIEPASIESLKAAIERMHNVTATFAQAVPVREEFEGAVVWEGVVHVFDVEGHPNANRAYAWSSPMKDTDNRRIFAALHIGPIQSPIDAVRAAIVAENRPAGK